MTETTYSGALTTLAVSSGNCRANRCVAAVFDYVYLDSDDEAHVRLLADRVKGFAFVADGPAGPDGPGDDLRPPALMVAEEAVIGPHAWTRCPGSPRVFTYVGDLQTFPARTLEVATSSPGVLIIKGVYRDSEPADYGPGEDAYGLSDAQREVCGSSPTWLVLDGPGSYVNKAPSVIDEIRWHPDMGTPLTLLLNGHCRLVITKALTAAVVAGALGRMDDAGLCALTIGTLAACRLESMDAVITV
jgi:hypothetical protein